MARSSTTWKKGQSGNPNGPPKKGESLTELMKEYLNGNYGNKEDKPLRKKIFIERVYQLAMKGDPTCMRMMWSYMDGLPVQKIEADVKYGKMSDEEIQEKLEGFIDEFDINTGESEEDSHDNTE